MSPSRAAAVMGLLLAWLPLAAHAGAWELRASGLAGDGARELAEPRTGSYRGMLLDASFSQRSGAWSVSLAATADQLSQAGPAAAGSQAELTEATLSWRTSTWGWAAGRQRLLWGRADIVNPTDVWTPRRHDRPSFRDRDQASGADTLQAWVAAAEDGVATLLVSPRLRPSRQGQGLLAGLPAAPVQSTDIATRSPAAALRWEGTSGPLDYALTVSAGAGLLPYIRPGGNTGLQARYGRQRMLGGDFARTVGDWVLRGEAAVLRREQDGSGLAPGGTRSYVLGAEHEFAPDWTFNVQWLSERHDAAPPAAAPLQALALLNRTLFHQVRQRADGVSLTIASNPLGSDHRLAVTALAYEGGESYLRLRWESVLAPHLSLGLLVERFRGAGGSTFNFLARNDVAWVFLMTSFGGD